MEAIDATDVITSLTAGLVGVLIWQAQRVITRMDRMEDDIHKMAVDDAALTSKMESMEDRIEVLERRRR